MGIEELLKDQREDILRIAAQHGAHNVRVFGSVARGEARPTAMWICSSNWSQVAACLIWVDC